jgi:deoxyribodipyrimidine photo-lyase
MTLWSSVKRCGLSVFLVTSSHHIPRCRVVAFSSTMTTSFIQTSDPVPEEQLPSWMLKERTRMLTSEDIATPKHNGKSIIYWCQRDVRTADNWALLFAAHLAETQKVPLHVMHVLPPPPQNSKDDEEIPELKNMRMTERHGRFYLGGLQLVHSELEKKQVAFHVVRPLSHRLVANTIQTQIIEEFDPRAIICDFSPLRHVRQWMEGALLESCEASELPLWQVDAHNVVPVWHAADKRQVGARTLRPKIHNVVKKFLQKFPKFSGNAHLEKAPKIGQFEYKAHQSFLEWDESVPAVKWAQPGTAAAKKNFESFVTTGGLSKFDSLRNNPNYTNICSGLSPWLNHGHMSFQRCMMAVKKFNRYATGSAAYIEEGLVRRELSDNYLFYTPDDYDKLTGAAGWAQETLQVHSSDPREYVYSLEELENGQTHDDLWNAAQLQAVREGRMHGFLRMYWAKKILEWSESPEVALRTAQYFNDKYPLDGRDPNGFVGVGWSIMGIHDMGWKEREIFGKIRFMNYNGCKRKFKVTDFVKKYRGAAENAAKAEGKQNEAKRGQKRKLKF